MKPADPRAPSCFWRVKAASVQGSSHRRMGQECQDHHCWRVLRNGILVAAVADGAGTAPLGGVGAALATQAAVVGLETMLIEPPGDEIGWRGAVLHALGCAREKLEAEALRQGAPLLDLATTLIVLAATPRLVVAAQVGDGAAVLANAQNEIVSLSAPPRGEFINETTFVVSEAFLERATVSFREDEVAHLAVLSDGLEMLALNMPERRPHRAFFVPLWRFAAKDMDDSTAQEEITSFLLSPRIAARSDDDLTLLLATLVGGPRGWVS